MARCHLAWLTRGTGASRNYTIALHHREDATVRLVLLQGMCACRSEQAKLVLPPDFLDVEGTAHASELYGCQFDEVYECERRASRDALSPPALPAALSGTQKRF